MESYPRFFFFKMHGELYQNRLLNGIFLSDLKYHLYLKLNSPITSVLAFQQTN